MRHPDVQMQMAGEHLDVQAPGMGRTFLQLQARGTVRLNRRTYLYTGVTGDYRHNRTDYAVSAGLRVAL